jgi:hypothetical protein
MTITWFDQRITCGQTTQKAKHGERLRTGKATHTVQRTGYAATVTPVNPTIWDASMDADLENTRLFNTATTPLIVRQLLKNWASTIPVDPTTWDASMDAELENTRRFFTATTPLIVRQLLGNWASTIPKQWQVTSRSGLEPHAIGSTFK